MNSWDSWGKLNAYLNRFARTSGLFSSQFKIWGARNLELNMVNYHYGQILFLGFFRSLGLFGISRALLGKFPSYCSGIGKIWTVSHSVLTGFLTNPSVLRNSSGFLYYGVVFRVVGEFSKILKVLSGWSKCKKTYLNGFTMTSELLHCQSGVRIVSGTSDL